MSDLGMRVMTGTNHAFSALTHAPDHVTCELGSIGVRRSVHISILLC